MSDEVICLSSDDENSPTKPHKSAEQVKIKLSSSVSNVIEESNANKRKLSLPSPAKKRIHLININTENPLTSSFLRNEKPSTSKHRNIDSDDEKELSVLKNKVDIKEERNNTENFLNSESNNDSNSNENGVEKPLLVVRKKQPANVSNGNRDSFAMFISQCLQRERSDDMEKIIEKLKRRYEELDPVYAASQSFADLLNDKRECLLNEKGYLYRHIGEVRDEMKSRKLGKCNRADFDSRPAQEYYDNESENNEVSDKDEEIEEDPVKARKKREKIRKLVKTMEIVQKRIQKYEETEVNFDDEDDSVFLKLERYKRRMVELHSMWCKLTDSDENAGRSYLLPKHLNKLTGIVIVDNAINSFINAKLAQKRTIDCVIFPDYVDILNLIHTHNVNNNLGMDQRAERAAAKSAFIKLGEYLQRVRQEDLFDSFSAFYEKYNDDDPANKYTELSNKLQENDIINKKNMNELLEQYSKMQEERQANWNNKNRDKNKDDDDNDNDHDDDDDNQDDDENSEDEDDSSDGDDEKDVSDVEEIDISDYELEIDEDNEETSSTKTDSIKETDQINKNIPTTKVDSAVETIKTDKDNSLTKIDFTVETNQTNKNNSSTKTDSLGKIDQIKKINLSVKIDSIIKVDQINKSHPSTKTDSLKKVDPTNKNIPSIKIDQLKKNNSLTKINFEIKVDQTNKNNSSAKTDSVDNVNSKNKSNSLTKTDCVIEVDQANEENSSGKTNSKDQVDILDGEHIKNEETKNEQPLLKLRSFAKPPKFWQSSQDVNTSEKKGTNSPIEIIDIDDSEEATTSSKTTNITKPNKSPRIVKILTKSVGIKKILRKAVITNNDGIKINDPKLVLPSTKLRILPLNKNAQHVNVTIVKPGVTLLRSAKKPNENVVQSSTVTTTVGRVLNPMAKIHPNSQRVTPKKDVIMKKSSVNA